MKSYCVLELCNAQKYYAAFTIIFIINETIRHLVICIAACFILKHNNVVRSVYKQAREGWITFNFVINNRREYPTYR